jgi:hypothetical protein
MINLDDRWPQLLNEKEAAIAGNLQLPKALFVSPETESWWGESPESTASGRTGIVNAVTRDGSVAAGQRQDRSWAEWGCCTGTPVANRSIVSPVIL